LSCPFSERCSLVVPAAAGLKTFFEQILALLDAGGGWQDSRVFPAGDSSVCHPVALFELAGG
jgi:hypothetical protein